MSDFAQALDGTFYMKVKDCRILTLMILSDHVPVCQFTNEPDEYYISFDEAIK